MTRILGILNITDDSFSDGGRYLATDAALAHAERLLADGADIVDVGAEATNPRARAISAAEEIERLAPVVTHLLAIGAAVSVDTNKPQVVRHFADLGVAFINDVTALRDPAAREALRATPTRVILMHSRSAAAQAELVESDPATIVDEIIAFFAARVALCEAAGISRDRLILDPGMGQFVGKRREVSLAILRQLSRLRAMGLPLCLCTSRKSFLGAVVADAAGLAQIPPPEERAAATLASEVWVHAAGVEYIRTHDPRALRDALAVWDAIRG